MAWDDPATEQQRAELALLAAAAGDDVPDHLLASEAAQRIDELRRHLAASRAAETVWLPGGSRPVEVVVSALL